jgi:hypothetical protein
MSFLADSESTSPKLSVPSALLPLPEAKPNLNGAVAERVTVVPPNGKSTSPPVAAAALTEIPSGVVGGSMLVPIDNWEFAERVWVGLRPHLRTRLWVLDALLARATVPVPGAVEEAIRLDKLAVEIHHLETEVDEVLQRRTSLTEFSSLLEHRVGPCLGQLERLQQALHEHHGV